MNSRTTTKGPEQKPIRLDKNIDIADPFARQLMAQYLGRRAADIPRLRDAAKARDFETIRIAGHRMLGSGATYGLEEISRLGEEMETAADAGDETAVLHGLQKLEQFLIRIRIQ